MKKKYIALLITGCLSILFIASHIHNHKDNSIETKEKEQTINIEEEPKEKEEKKKEEKEPELIDLGEFRLTAYCKCKICCGKWSGSPTASGTEPKAKHTIAVDIDVIPFGTEVIIDGITYTAEDTGSAIKGKRIDIYMNSHEEALEFGVQYKNVYKK